MAVLEQEPPGRRPVTSTPNRSPKRASRQKMKKRRNGREARAAWRNKRSASPKPYRQVPEQNGARPSARRNRASRRSTPSRVSSPGSPVRARASATRWCARKQCVRRQGLNAGTCGVRCSAADNMLPRPRQVSTVSEEREKGSCQRNERQGRQHAQPKSSSLQNQVRASKHGGRHES